MIAGTAIAAYRNTFSVPFVFDDSLSIAGNPTIRHLWPLWPVLFPPHGQGLTVEGRPILNLSLAINYAISGTRVWSYHAVNLLIHILAGLTLFGIVRRTLESLSLAFAIALIWTLHPLQTESVTYIVQRAESLMGLFYLLTLYCFIRHADETESEKRKAESGNVEQPKSGFSLSAFRFPLFSVAACLLGMATKEVMVSAPLIVFLYDRTFITGSFRESWRARRLYYLGLSGTWLLLLFLACGAGSRGRTVGFGVGTSPWDYALTQFPAIVHYLRLSFWPRPLIFDYGAQWVRRPSEVLWDAVVVTALAVGGAWALKFRTSKFEFRNFIGFACAWFFLILAPTSVIPLIRQTMAEHRMYLPLAAVIAVAVCAIYRVAGRALSTVVFVAAAAGCLILTARRNEDYRTKVVLYRDTAAKRPDNVLAHYNLGMALAESGMREEAIVQFREAIHLEPEFPQAYFNIGNALFAEGQIEEAAAQYEAALRINPNYAEAHYALGDALFRLGRIKEARWHFNAAFLINPNDAKARDRLKAIER